MEKKTTQKEFAREKKNKKKLKSSLDMPSIQAHLLSNFNNAKTSDIRVEIYKIDEPVCKGDNAIKAFDCHVLMLCRYPYWKNMLVDNQFSEKSERVVRLKWFDDTWMDVGCFEWFLKSFYVDQQHYESIKQILLYVRELHYLSVSIQFKSLTRFCERKMAEAITLENVPDVLRYTLFVYPDYSRASTTDDGKDVTMPWKNSFLYKTLLQWICAFYPIDKADNHLRLATDQMMQNNFSLIKNLFQNEKALFKGKSDRMNALQQAIENCNQRLVPNQLEIYQKINSMCASDSDYIHRSCVYFTLTDKNNLADTDHPIGKEFTFRNIIWRYSYIPKLNTISIYACPNNFRSTAPHILSKARNSLKKINIAITITCLTSTNTFIIKANGTMVPGNGCRFDIPDTQKRFLSDPFVLDKDGNSVAVACIELSFLGHLQ